MPSDVLAELSWRGLIHQHTDGVAAHLAEPRVGYCGFDATGPSLHVGHLIPILGLRRLLIAGHRAVALVGDGTALIGDPSGRSQERRLLDAATVAENAEAVAAQLVRIVDPEGEYTATGRLVIERNARWLSPARALDFLRDVGKHFTVRWMLQKESVATRLDSGISFTEFSYMLLQAWDFLELRRRYGVTLQVGGSDQWGNMTAGMELIRRAGAGEAHVITFPLLTSAAGTKFGKTEGGAVWLDPERTSPSDFYQFWVRTDDRDVPMAFRRFTFLSRADVEAVDAAVATTDGVREALRRLAWCVTQAVHGAAAADAARDRAVRGGGALAPADLERMLAEGRGVAVDVAPRDLTAHRVLECLLAAGIATSRGDLRRNLQAGAYYFASGRRIGTVDQAVPRSEVVVDGETGASYVVLRRGKKHEFFVLKLPGQGPDAVA